jgi:hypothetical protein
MAVCAPSIENAMTIVPAQPAATHALLRLFQQISKTVIRKATKCALL